MIVLSFVILSFSLFSCQKEKIEKTAINLNSTTCNVEADGGNYRIDYTIENPVDNIRLLAECEATWIKDIKTGSSKIEFYAEPNLNEESRETVMTLKYDKITVAVKIIQAAAESTADAIKIVINDITTNSVTMSAYPKDLDMMYDFLVWDASLYDSYTEEQVWEQMIGRYITIAQQAGMSLEEYLAQDTKNIKRGNTENFTVDKLPASYKCYAVAVGISPQGEQQTDIIKVAFSTKEPEAVELSFELSVEIDKTDGTRGTIKAIPSDETLPYFVTSARVVDLENTRITPEEYAKFVMDTMIEFYTSFGMQKEQILALILKYGESSSEISSMNLETDNLAIAIGTDDQGNINTSSKATTCEFRTPDAPDSDNQFTVTVSNVNVDRFDIEISVTNDDSYGIIVDKASEYNGKTDDEIIRILQGKQLLEGSYHGNFKDTYIGLEADTEYYIFVLGVNTGAATTAITKEHITSLPKGNVNDFTFTSTVEDITAHTVSLKAHPDPKTLLYIWGVVDGSATSDIVKDKIEEIYQTNKIYYSSRLEFMLDYGKRGDSEMEVEGLLSNTKYKTYAICIDDETGEYATDAVFGETFTTLEAVISDATITLSYDKYWDIDALAEIYPADFGQYAYSGRFCMPVKVETTGDPSVTYLSALEGDYTDTDATSDEVLAILLSGDPNSIKDQNPHMVMKYNTDITLVAVAEDVNGNYSRVYRSLINLTSDGASPVEEYTLPSGVIKKTNAGHAQYRFFEINRNGNRPADIRDIYNKGKSTIATPAIDYGMTRGHAEKTRTGIYPSTLIE